MARFTHTIEEFELGEEQCEVTVEISYTVGRYIPATREQPAEDAEIDYEAKVTGIVWHDEETGEPMTCKPTDSDLATVQAKLDDMDFLDQCRDHADKWPL